MRSSVWTPCVSFLCFVFLCECSSLCVHRVSLLAELLRVVGDRLALWLRQRCYRRSLHRLGFVFFAASPPLWLRLSPGFPLLVESLNDERRKSRQRKSTVFRNSPGKSENIDDKTKSLFLQCLCRVRRGSFWKSQINFPTGHSRKPNRNCCSVTLDKLVVSAIWSHSAFMKL